MLPFSFSALLLASCLVLYPHTILSQVSLGGSFDGKGFGLMASYSHPKDWAGIGIHYDVSTGVATPLFLPRIGRKKIKLIGLVGIGVRPASWSFRDGWFFADNTPNLLCGGLFRWNRLQVGMAKNPFSGQIYGFFGITLK